MDDTQELSSKEFFFAKGIKEYGAENTRDFIWRGQNDNFFVVFVAEFFLRKTRSETVDKFMRDVFLKKFTTFCDVAKEEEEELKSLLRPLGLYNQRATALKDIALQLCCSKNLPSYDELLKLPHCGRYIANAVECFFYKNRRSIVDHNVQRVLNRFFSIPEAAEIHKADYLWNFAERLLPQNEFVSYNYALLDFSALVCKPIKPKCSSCSLAQKCDFHRKKQLLNAGGAWNV